MLKWASQRSPISERLLIYLSQLILLHRPRRRFYSPIPVGRNRRPNRPGGILSLKTLYSTPTIYNFPRDPTSGTHQAELTIPFFIEHYVASPATFSGNNVQVSAKIAPWRILLMSMLNERCKIRRRSHRPPDAIGASRERWAKSRVPRIPF